MLAFVGSIVSLAAFAPIVFNFEEYFRIGYYSVERNYRTTYSDGYGQLNMGVQLTLVRDDRYDYDASCFFTSGNNVDIIGLKFINHTINVGGSIITAEVLNFDPPTEQLTRRSRAKLEHGVSLVWSGSAEVQFISESVVQNETIEFSLVATITLTAQNYYELGLLSYVVLFLWFLAFPITPFVLKAIFQPRFGVPLDDDTEERHKRYLDYFKKSKEEQEKTD